MTSNDRKEGSTHQVKRAGGLARWWWVAAGLVVLLAAVAWLRPANEQKAEVSSETEQKTDPNVVNMVVEAQRNIKLSVEPARTGKVVDTIQATGTVGPNETRVVPMRPLARGRVERVLVRLGDAVRKGQALVVYDNVELGELIGQYMVGLAALEKARADAEVAKRSVERAGNLVDLGAVARAELERRNAEAASAASAINTQRAELAQIEEKFHRFGLTDADVRQFEKSGADHREVSRSTLVAPFDGVITAYDVSEGQVVDTASQLLTIVDLSTVWIQANIYEKDIAAVRVGLSVPVSVESYPNQVFACQTTYISDLLDPKTRTARMRCEVPNPDRRLKLDMFVTLKIPSPSGREAVMVPATAIQRINDRPVVFVRQGETTFIKRDVDAGATSGELVEIRSGVKAGEQVVTNGSFQLKSTLLRAEIGGEE